MKKKDLKELKAKDLKELIKEVKELEKEVTSGLLELKMDKIKNVHSIRNKRKDIAQIKTVIVMKQISLDTSGDKDKEANLNAAS